MEGYTSKKWPKNAFYKCFCKGHIDRPQQYIEGLQKLLSLILLFVNTVEAFFDLRQLPLRLRNAPIDLWMHAGGC